VTDPLVAGWEQLRRGRWDDARASFAAAGERAEALEGLSWAAWWRDDAEAVFAARRRAYALYRERDDRAGAARMATWLAADELDFHGAASVAGGWLARARRLLEGLPAGPEQGWLAFHEGYAARLAGDHAAARERAVAAAQAGRRLGIADLEMLGLALEGATLVTGAQVEDGMRRLGEATVAALEGEAELPISSAWTFCFLVSACIAVYDYDRAAEWCARIERFAERYGSRYMLGFCRAEYGEVHLAGGRWAQAEALLEAARDDLAHARPPFAAGPLAALAELRRRQGRRAEAARLLERAGPSTAAELCRARLALDRGEPREAAERLERLLRRLPAGAALARTPAVALLVRARAACGELAAAAAALRELREPPRDTVDPGPVLRASADVAEAGLLTAAGEHERARALLEDAVDGFAGAPYERACARRELAATLGALGRTEAAAAEAAGARQALHELGAAAARLPELTRREREVLAVLATGLTNDQIAERLVVSPHTVHRHVTNILRKLGLPSRTAAAAHAARAGLLSE
jgi:LuxR family maltose regulon positive regulatory protein